MPKTVQGRPFRALPSNWKPLQAYNLTVADWHTYFVKGDKAETEGVWVHNECPYGKSPRKIVLLSMKPILKEVI